VILTHLFVYPIKSLGGIRLTEAVVEPRGLRHDRRWMLIDPHSRQFLTQRTDATLALLAVGLEADALVVHHRTRPELGTLRVPLTEPLTRPVSVTIWEDTVPALPVSAAADAWFTVAINRPAQLVYMPDSTRRPVDPERAPRAIVSFADGYPLLAIGEAALAELNHRLTAASEAPVPMDRFRPNLVFQGGAPHAEDAWGAFRIGEVAFQGVKKCARCIVTTIDQQTAVTGKEPLRTLNKYRRTGNKVDFGQDVVPLTTGVVRVGEVLVVG
jgi:uncharacterized protein